MFFFFLNWFVSGYSKTYMDINSGRLKIEKRQWFITLNYEHDTLFSNLVKACDCESYPKNINWKLLSCTKWNLSSFFWAGVGTGHTEYGQAYYDACNGLAAIYYMPNSPFEESGKICDYVRKLIDLLNSNSENKVSEMSSMTDDWIDNAFENYESSESVVD
jgi:hypothetical protein